MSATEPRASGPWTDKPCCSPFTAAPRFSSFPKPQGPSVRLACIGAGRSRLNQAQCVQAPPPLYTKNQLLVKWIKIIVFFPITWKIHVPLLFPGLSLVFLACTEHCLVVLCLDLSFLMQLCNTFSVSVIPECLTK